MPGLSNNRIEWLVDGTCFPILDEVPHYERSIFNEVPFPNSRASLQHPIIRDTTEDPSDSYSCVLIADFMC